MKAFHYRLAIAECDVSNMDLFLVLSGMVLPAGTKIQSRKSLSNWRTLKIAFVFMLGHFRCIKILTWLLGFGE